MDRFNKLRIALRAELRGMARVDHSYQVAVDAFHFAEKKIKGVRKDGQTPNFMHAMEVLAYLMTLPNLRYPAETYAVAILHDVLEDTDTERAECFKRFGERVTTAVVKLSKVIEGSKILSISEYFKGMVSDPIASIVKGGDRISNQGSMEGVISQHKQIEQLAETETYILPMLKEARSEHPDQYAAYLNIKLVLHTQVSLFKALHRHNGA